MTAMYDDVASHADALFKSLFGYDARKDFPLDRKQLVLIEAGLHRVLDAARSAAEVSIDKAVAETVYAESCQREAEAALTAQTDVLKRIGDLLHTGGMHDGYFLLGQVTALAEQLAAQTQELDIVKDELIETADGFVKATEALHEAEAALALTAQTKARLRHRLQAIIDNDEDREMNHIDADRVLLEFIDDPDVTRLFEAIGKWYA